MLTYPSTVVLTFSLYTFIFCVCEKQRCICADSHEHLLLSSEVNTKTHSMMVVNWSTGRRSKEIRGVFRITCHAKIVKAWSTYVIHMFHCNRKYILSCANAAKIKIREGHLHTILCLITRLNSGIVTKNICMQAQKHNLTCQKNVHFTRRNCTDVYWITSGTARSWKDYFHPLKLMKYFFISQHDPSSKHQSDRDIVRQLT